MISPGPLPAAASQAAHSSRIVVASERQRGQWRPRARRFTPPPWGPGAALVAFVAQDLLILAIGFALYLLGVRHGIVVGATLVEVVFVTVALLLARRAGGRLSAGDFGVRKTRPRAAVGLALLALIALGFAQAGYDALVSPSYSNQFAGVPAHPLIGVIALGFSASLLAPFTEELFYRGFVYGGLRRRLGPPAAIAISSLLFGLDHWLGGYSLGAAGAVAVTGVFLCLLYELTGSLWPGVALHAYIDGSAFADTRGVWGTAQLITLAVIAFFLIYPSIDPVRRLRRLRRLAPAGAAAKN